ncbi:hypothetical protein G6F57_007965 [Rhizopus arrhizus]|uniref:Homeobox domain-containing protein n=1 Tax=Rhizopus oryzae TaxID=64495 RepID=A0A9P6X5D0_RHIOR|nr:hypothetical protein G6F23_003466 [Rhizopus arrhizus]KAG0760404.1 hypothetical protein G6F24_008344 [Rhizopus arrhizus]KAG0787595.1 hypothetical protein G6F21_007801 [Rhizopus arrhizus]KAG0790044.1 hypothetical protein G6F22_006523 [Rhizopus arrhizus]KAG0811969.1 hypothetical protein G6F20_006739 [Rhizopus arrhizus]
MSINHITATIVNNDNVENVNYINIFSQPQYNAINNKPPFILSTNMFIPPPPPFIIPPLTFDEDLSRTRKRTRATPEQLAILEKSFNLNPSPNSRVREQLSLQLGMTERSIQIWFQNRRAKVKNQTKRSMQMQDRNFHMQQQYAASAATAACQASGAHQQQGSLDPNLYNYYYQYYLNHMQQQQLSKTSTTVNIPADVRFDDSTYTTENGTEAAVKIITPSSVPVSHSFSVPANQCIHNTYSSIPDLTLSASTSSSPNIFKGCYKKHSANERIRAHSVGPYPYYHRKKLIQQERHSSMGPPSSSHCQSPSYDVSSGAINDHFYNPVILEEPINPCLITDLFNKIFNLAAQTLQIGTWKRICELNCKLDVSNRTLIWCIGDGNQQHKFRMDISLDLVQFIRMKDNTLEIFIRTPELIQFYMSNVSPKTEWIQCHDFTQDKQGSSENLHVLTGCYLEAEFMEIVTQVPELQSLLVKSDEDGVMNNLLLLQSLHIPNQ